MEIPFLNLSLLHQQIKSEMRNAFDAVYDNHWYIMGDYLTKFEKDYATYNQTKYAIGVSNGLDALVLAIRALNITSGDEVIVPANTYIASALAVSQVGARPIFVDPDEKTYNITTNNIEKVISSKTKAIMPVHLYGQACEMDKIMELASHYDLLVVEDNAQAHGAEYKAIKTGSWGHINGTSFYPGKNLGAIGDAGAITTNNVLLAEKVFMLRNYGSRIKYQNEVIGYNMRLDELQAAFLSVKLKYLQSWTLERQAIASWYNTGLTGIGDIIIPYCHPDSSHVYHLYVIQTSHRDKLQAYLKAAGIGTLIHYPIPPHLQMAYKHLGLSKGEYPIAEKMAQFCLSLPIWIGMTQEEVNYIVNKIIDFFNSK